MAVLPDPGRSRAVLIGASAYRRLEDLPAVRNNLSGFRDVLVAPALGGLPADNCTVVAEPATPVDLYRALRQHAEDAEDTLLVYFAGHGRIGSRNELWLCLPDTDPDELPYSALAYDELRRVVADSRATKKAVILDCCFSGRALADQAGDEETIVGQVGIAGTYLLTATTANAVALAPPGERYTAFTGTLLGLLNTGIPGGPELLTFGQIYPRLQYTLTSRQLPQPRQQNSDTIAHLALTRNLAYTDRPATSGDTQDPLEEQTAGSRNRAFGDPSRQLQIGDQIAGYRIEDQIGRGGTSVIYRAYDTDLDRRVALKVIAPELAFDGEFRKRFKRESRAATAVRHPNIIPVHEAGEADGILFIAMHYVDRGDAQTLIGRELPLPTSRVCDIVDQVASALDTAHDRGLVHGNVKPGNILLEATPGRAQPDHVYLSGFGLSRHPVHGSVTDSSAVLGTLQYGTPEWIVGGPVDGRSDEYALACSAFEMLAGAPPFPSDLDTTTMIQAKLYDPPPSLTSRRQDLPAAIDPVMAKALAKAPDDRYNTCLDFAAALRRAAKPALDGAAGARPRETDGKLNDDEFTAAKAKLLE